MEKSSADAAGFALEPLNRGTIGNQANNVNSAVQSFVLHGSLIVSRSDDFLMDVVDAYINALLESGLYPAHLRLLREAYKDKFGD